MPDLPKWALHHPVRALLRIREDRVYAIAGLTNAEALEVALDCSLGREWAPDEAAQIIQTVQVCTRRKGEFQA